MLSQLDYGKTGRAARTGAVASKCVVYTLLGIWGLVVLFPFYWMLLTSVKSYGAYNSEFIPQLFTLSPTLQNYADAFTAVPLGRYAVEQGHMAGQRHRGQHRLAVQCIEGLGHHLVDVRIAAGQESIGTHAVYGNQDHLVFKHDEHSFGLSECFFPT